MCVNVEAFLIKITDSNIPSGRQTESFRIETEPSESKAEPSEKTERQVGRSLRNVIFG